MTKKHKNPYLSSRALEADTWATLDSPAEQTEFLNRKLSQGFEAWRIRTRFGYGVEWKPKETQK